jgi:hypothetical protein
VALDSVDTDELKRVKDFERQRHRDALVDSYNDLSELREKLHRHIHRTVIDKLNPSRHESLDALRVGVVVPQGEDLPVQSSSNPEELRFRELAQDIGTRLAAEWRAERDSDPIDVNDGKEIVRRAQSRLVDLRSMPFAAGSTRISSEIDELLKRLAALKRHELFMGGGLSFTEFWSLGDAVMERITTISEPRSEDA